MLPHNIDGSFLFIAVFHYMNVPQFINPAYCHCTVWSYYEKSCNEHSCPIFWWTFLLGPHTYECSCRIKGQADV